MNDEIKAILADLNLNVYETKEWKEPLGLNQKTWKTLLDYITNLQHTEDLYNQLLKDYDEEIEENIKLTKLWKNEVEKRRKAVDFINKHKKEITKEEITIFNEDREDKSKLKVGTFMWHVDELIDILNGDNNE